MNPIETIAPHSSREEWLFFALGWLFAVALMMALRLLPPKRVRLRSGGVLLAMYLLLFLGRRITSDWQEVSSGFGTAVVILYGVLLGRLAFQITFDIVIARSRKDPMPRIVRDISQGVVFLFVAIWSLRLAGVEMGHLLTTSALLTVVAGLALQETLGNLVAGLSIQADRPFDVGDWIEVHGSPGHIGRVREINWRATRLVTLDNVDVVVPNGMIAKASVTNYDRPHYAARRSIYFYAPYNIPPNEVREVVLDAIRGSNGVLSEPAPSLVTFGFDGNGIHYWLRFFLADMSRRDGIDGGVRDRIWYAFARRGWSFPLPGQTLQLHQVTESSRAAEEERSLESRIQALSQIAMLAPLDRANLAVLARRSRRAPYTAGEIVIRQGESGDTMFVVGSGELSIRVSSDGRAESEAARIGPGSFFGEMSLLTGDPRRATVVAITTCELFVIDHQAFKDLLSEHPEIAQQISAKVVERQVGLETKTAQHPSHLEVAERSDALVDRIMRFFRS